MDDPEQTTEQTEESSSPEPTEQVESPESPPWGDDFDPQKAWDTIQTQRSSEKELKQQLQSQRDELLRDQQFVNEVLDTHGYELVDDEDPDLEYEEEPGDDERYQTLERELSQLKESMGQRAFDNDLGELASKAGVELDDRDRQLIEDGCQQHGANRAGLEKAFGDWQEWRKARDKAVIDGYVKGKKNAPHVSQVGSSATEVPDLDDRQERVRWMTERYRQAQ